MAGYPVNCQSLGVNLEDVEDIENHIKRNCGNKIPKARELIDDARMEKSEGTCRVGLALIKIQYGLTKCTNADQKENIVSKPKSSSINPRKR